MTEPNAGRLAVEVVADLRGFAQRLQADVDKAAADVTAQVGVDVQAADLKERLRGIVGEASTDLRAEVGVDVQSTGLRERLDAVVKEADAGKKAKLGVDVDAKGLSAKVRAEKEKAQKSAGSINLPIKLDVKKSGADLAKVVGLLKIPAIVAAIGPAVSGIAALGSGLYALVSAAAPAVGLLGLVPGTVASFVQGFAAAKLATGGLGDAFKQVASAQQRLQSGQKLTTAEVGKLRAALANVSPAARQFVEVITALRPAFTQLRREVQQQFFSQFVGQVNGLARQALPILRAELADTGAVLGDFVGGLGRAFSRGGLFNDMRRVLSVNNTVLAYFGQTATQLLRALFDVLVVSGPMLIRFAQATTRVADSVFSFTTKQRSSGGMARFFQQAATTAAQLGRILRNLTVGLYGLGRAAAPLGRSLLDTFEKTTARFAEFTNSLSGQNRLQAYFAAIRPTLREVGLLIDAVGRGVARLSSDHSIAPLLAQIRTQLGPALSNLSANLSQSFGPALVEAATAAVNLIAALSAGGGGGLTAFLQTITAIVNALTYLITTVPGASTALTGFFIAAGTAKAVLGVTGIIGGAGKAIFEVGKQAAAATTGTLGFVRGLAGVTGGAGSALGAAQKVGLALRVNFGLGAQAAVSGMVSLVGQMATTSARVFEIVKAIRLATVATALWTAAQWLLDIAMDANPIGVAILSTAALITGIILLIKYWRQVTDFFLHSRIAIAVVAVAFGVLGVAVLELIRHWRAVVGFFTASWRVIEDGVGAAVNFVQAAIQVGFGAAAAVVRVTMTVIGAVVKATMAVVAVAVAVGMAVARAAVIAFTAVLPIITAVLGLFRAIFNLVFQAVRLVVVAVMLAVYLAIRGTLLGILAVWNPTWALIQRVVQFVWGIIRAVVTTQINAIRVVIAAVMAFIQAIWSAAWGLIKTVAVIGLNAVRAAVNAGMGAVRAVVSAVVGAIRGLWQAFWGSTVGRVVSFGISAVIAGVQRLAAIVGLAVSIAGRFARAIGDGLTGALRAVLGFVSRAASTVEGLIGRFFNAGVAMVSALIRGITSKIQAAADAIGRLASRLAAKLPGSPVKEGPLRVLNRGRAGQQIVEMLIGGINSRRSHLSYAAGQLAAAFALPGGTGLPSGQVAVAAALGGGRAPAVSSSSSTRSQVSNFVINAAPDVPTPQQILRVLSYAEALHA